MSVTLAAGGWLAAVAAATTARIVLARRMELVARACHELRGPLTAARLAVHLADGPGTPRGPLQAIDIELGRARLALADLSAARQGGSADDRIDTFDVGALLAEVAQAGRTQAAIDDRRLRLEALPNGILVRGDRDRLARAIANLIANAIEHGDGTILVRGRAGVHTVRIEVLDEGPGLPAPVALLVRGPRAGLGARGRGLAIAFDTAARHGGLLAAAPTDRGARLVLDLPTVPSSPA